MLCVLQKYVRGTSYRKHVC